MKRTTWLRDRGMQKLREVLPASARLPIQPIQGSTWPQEEGEMHKAQGASRPSKKQKQGSRLASVSHLDRSFAPPNGRRHKRRSFAKT